MKPASEAAKKKEPRGTRKKNKKQGPKRNPKQNKNQTQNNKTQGGGARSAPPPWGNAEGGVLLFSIWQWKPGIKTKWKLFLIEARPNFWPQIENRLWVVLALNKKPSPGGTFLVGRPHCSRVAAAVMHKSSIRV